MREHKKKWLFDKGKTSGSKKRWSYGGDFADERKSKNYKDIEDAPKKSGMKTGVVFNNRLNFSPLRRFLKAKVGKNWDEIYSEMRERIPADIWDVHQPASYYVSIKVEILADGSIVDTQGWGVSRVTISKDGKTHYTGRPHYFVHPETNVLCRLEPSKSPGKLGKPKMTKKEGKILYAKVKKERNQLSVSYKKGAEERSKEAEQIMINKKRKKDDNTI